MGDPVYRFWQLEGGSFNFRLGESVPLEADRFDLVVIVGGTHADIGGAVYQVRLLDALEAVLNGELR